MTSTTRAHFKITTKSLAPDITNSYLRNDFDIDASAPIAADNFIYYHPERSCVQSI
jgi:hypothetical protein